MWSLLSTSDVQGGLCTHNNRCSLCTHSNNVVYVSTGAHLYSWWVTPLATLLDTVVHKCWASMYYKQWQCSEQAAKLHCPPMHPSLDLPGASPSSSPVLCTTLCQNAA